VRRRKEAQVLSYVRKCWMQKEAIGLHARKEKYTSRSSGVCFGTVREQVEVEVEGGGGAGAGWCGADSGVASALPRVKQNKALNY
jgi:hypothetical protein